MSTLLPTFLAATLLAALQGQDNANATYPAQRHETVVRFYNLKGKLEIGALNSALRTASFELAYGPRSAPSRPNNTVIGVSVPADLKSKEVERVLRKAKIKSEALEAFLFEGRVENGFPTFGLGLTKLDYMLGMSGDIRWCDMVEWTPVQDAKGPKATGQKATGQKATGQKATSRKATIFYCVAGKLKAAKIEDLWRKLQKPLGIEDATLGNVVSDSFTWKLPEPVEARRAKKLVKAIEKLEGISAAEIAGDSLSLTVELAGLSLYGPARSFDGGPLDPAQPARGTVCTNALWDLLVDEELTPSGP